MQRVLCQPAVRKESGFTLLEMMVVLCVFMVCLAAALIPLRTTVSALNDRQFFQQVERDLFAAQAYAIAKNKNIAVDFFENGTNYYHIYTYDSARKTIEKREIPSRFKLDARTAGTIVFLRKGTVSRTGSIFFATQEKTIRLVFLIGRGRFYFSSE